MKDRPLVFTIGHSNRTLEDFVGLVKTNGVAMVADVRTVPRSRHNPQFNQETLPVSLSAEGIGYRHMPGLGGLRRPCAGSPNSAWRNPSFRGFADYMQTAEFEASLSALVDLAREQPTVLMCAEAVHWRCHRSLISDALVSRGARVIHILSRTRNQEHVLTAWLQVVNGRLVYPAPVTVAGDTPCPAGSCASTAYPTRCRRAPAL